MPARRKPRLQELGLSPRNRILWLSLPRADPQCNRVHSPGVSAVLKRGWGLRAASPAGPVGPPTSLHFPLPFPCGLSWLERSCRLPAATTVIPRTSLKSRSPRRRAQALAQEAGPRTQNRARRHDLHRQRRGEPGSSAGARGRGWEASCGFAADWGLAVWRPTPCAVCAGVTVGLSSWERLWVFKRDESGA